jgi:hypothetical protein
VYSRQLTAHKGFDNELAFKFLNANQKPIDISEYTVCFAAFDSNRQQVLSATGTPSDTVQGLATVTLTRSQTADLSQQYLDYIVYLTNNETAATTITYNEPYFNNSGVLYLSNSATTLARPPEVVDTFLEVTEDTPYWASEAVPTSASAASVHTVAVYSTGYSGTVTVEATLDPQVTSTTAWATVAAIILDGSETEPVYTNATGAFAYIRIRTSADPVLISQVLIRN